MGLGGIIVKEICGLSFLRSLIISDNNFHGFIPNEMGKLSQLREIDMQYNELSGSISTSLGFLENLEKLNLSYNRFNGDIPNGIFNLSSLIEVNLRNNILSGSLLTDICYNLPKIEMLRISMNQIGGNIPPSLGTCTNLKLLSLSYNNFAGSIPMEIENLSMLQIVYLGANKLIGNIPNEIGNLSALVYLDLDRNSFIELRLLNFDGNQLTNDPSMLELDFLISLINCRQLKDIRIGTNSFDGMLPRALGNLSASIQAFTTAFCGIKGIIPNEIGNMSNLIELRIGGNELTGIIPDTLGQLTKVQMLRLNDNKLPGQYMSTFAIWPFGNLIALQNLDLSQNNLYGVIPKSLEKLEDLVYFNVSFNELSGEIPNGGPFKNLPADFFRWKLQIVWSFSIQGHAMQRNTLLSAPSTSPITIKRIPYYEVLNATNKFNEGNLIGIDSIDSVYRGIFSDGMIAAIKVFNLDLEGANKSFDTECHILCNIRHRNLDKVITSCSNLDLKALVLEYMPNGNFNKWLSSSN
ncbi:Leucine-rich repeat protein kinase family protein [Abeliophyllum distichum]|uniref:Leucine-rich repeat protein kinase family protein n=1 Tax=Abeliophyllum distichum TaxID=126358 RepID=A0ABD1QL89_9LAMI